LPIDAKESLLSSESLKTIDEIPSADTQLLTAGAIQEEFTKKLSSPSAYFDEDTRSVLIRSSSYGPPSPLPTLKHRSEKDFVYRSQPVPPAAVVTPRAQASVSMYRAKQKLWKTFYIPINGQKLKKFLRDLDSSRFPARAGIQNGKIPAVLLVKR